MPEQGDDTEAAEPLNPAIDATLLAFIELVEAAANVGDGTTEIGIPLTLIVGGATASGVVTAGKHWWHDFDALMRQATAGPNAETSSPFVEMIADRFRDITEETYSTMPELTRIQYLHLRNAKVIHPNGTVPTSDGLLMRVDLAKVEGWALGHLAP